ncbi:hypothetical protein HMN09_00090200 [Mycena chlorophos]|uniref:Probable guanine deaminase n=1 Tax=Mycena chlorophos TaxID=658473 RepID=A0A8H6TSV3_MYCCL|nr:hypothetical protein HMN09_00090200 [Mycena chlorophos]
MAPIVYYGAVVNPVDHSTLRDMSACLLGVGEAGTIDWLEEHVEDSMVQEVMAKHGYVDVELVALRQEEFLVPGFIDTHTHAPQVPNMGSGQQYELLDWLEKITFPMESKFRDPEFAKRTYPSVVRRIIDSGTTTCCYFGTIHLEGTKTLADIVHAYGQRAFVGKCNMDSNCPDHYKEPTVETSIAATKDLISHISRLPDSLVYPILTPRFAISCSAPLLKGLGDVAAADPSLAIQTHISENPSEVAFTRSLFPQHTSYAHTYAESGLLRSNTILAHAVHLTEDEIELIHQSGAGISHCPTSNFHLKSGVAPIGRYLDRGIKVGLGTDVSGGYSPSMLSAIQNASIASKVIEMNFREKSSGPPSPTQFTDKQLSMETLLYLATLGGAAVCNLEKIVGSFAVGKSFDALLVNVGNEARNPGIWGSAGSALGSVRGHLEQFLWGGDDPQITLVCRDKSRVALISLKLSCLLQSTCPAVAPMSAEDDALSDLTDLDELSEEYEDSSKKKKGKGRGKSGEYLIRHSLKTPRATTYSTESLFKQIDNGDIDLEPEYQRDVVWPESKQIKIIDSIFRNYYVPPVIFALNINDDGTETRTCIDGKQRLTSIHRFMQGLIPHRDPDTNDKYWYTDNPLNRTAKTKTMLPDKYRRLWDTKAVVCVEYSDLKEADEREIFTRVQLGVALTPAEKLKVIATPRANFVRKLQELYLNNDESALSGGSLNWNRSRGSDFRCLAQMLQWIESSAKTSSFINIEKWLSDSVAVGPQFTSAVENTFAIYEALASQEDWVLKKIAPIEFIAIGLILYEFRDRMSVAGLAKCVDSMRKDLRKITSDIRNNSRMQKAVMTFMEKFKVPALTRGEVCAEDAIKTSGLKVKKTAGVKRKAPVDDEEEDSEEEYVPAKKAKAAKTAPTTKTTTKAKAAPSPKKRAPANAEPAKAAAASAPVAAAPPQLRLQRPVLPQSPRHQQRLLLLPTTTSWQWRSDALKQRAQMLECRAQQQLLRMVPRASRLLSTSRISRPA